MIPADPICTADAAHRGGPAGAAATPVLTGGVPGPWAFCVAPMVDWTDRHCRWFLRQLSHRARLYTEMIATGAVLHGHPSRVLAFDPDEHPLALQLGGSDPDELARAARIGERFGYDEINLNCGCPSDRVVQGAFGACLMREPARVAEAIRAMRDAVSVPVTVKHRIGLGRDESESLVFDFVGALHEAGCRTFLVHARNAWLDGLSPKANREVPPLRYAVVHRLKHAFPDATVVLNGGLQSLADAEAHARGLDGVMFGRAAYHDPWLLTGVDAWLAGAAPGGPAPAGAGGPTREAVVERLAGYAARGLARGVPLRALARHVLGLYHGQPGARAWRRTLSDARRLDAAGPELLFEAREATRRARDQAPAAPGALAAAR
jgi:tRNA-dihydrouridine synthase A